MSLPGLAAPCFLLKRPALRTPAHTLSLPHGLSARLASWGARVSITLLLLVGIVFTGLQPVHADAGRFLSGSDHAELSAELATLQPDPATTRAPLTAAQQQRLADLEALERQIASSDDRAQLSNRSTHNLGLFARFKKDPADQPPSFSVLAPGHSSDDDFDLVALLIPAGVSLSWPEGGEAAASSSSPRVVRVLEGQQLEVSDAAAPLTYQLSQPPFQLLSRWDPQPALPDLSQAALDLEPESAPLD